MKNLRGKYSSVELQHEATKIWTKSINFGCFSEFVHSITSLIRVVSSLKH
ncbi:MAG TPA: hypothetical protein VJG30_04350 [Candidatus Nanoarchaeia archaeon]|nr:hypothetical protein [Candidatus Nanoarchaeia archaeon]